MRRRVFGLLIACALCFSSYTCAEEAGVWGENAISAAEYSNAGVQDEGEVIATEYASVELLNEVDLSGLEPYAEEAGIAGGFADLVRRLAQGEVSLEPDKLLECLVQAGRAELRGLVAPFGALLVALLLWGMNRRLLEGCALREAAGYVCYLAGAGSLLALFTQCAQRSSEAVGRAGALSDALAPVLAALLASSAAGGSASVVSAAAALASSVLADALRVVGPALSAGVAVCAAAGHLNEKIDLGRLGKWMADAAGWLCGIALTLFLGLVALFGSLASVRDGVMLRTAKYAVDNLFPVVGGELADAAGAVAASAVVVKGAVGVAGVALLVGVCVKPMLAAALACAVCRLAAALAEPISDGPMIGMTEGFAAAFRTLLVCVATAAAMAMILIGAAVAGGRTVAMLA